MTPSLSILCVTRAEAHAWPFLSTMADLSHALGADVIFAADRCSGEQQMQLQRVARTCWSGAVIPVSAQDHLESVLDEALGYCTGENVLRLDDDERCSPAMVRWLESGTWASAPSWAFATAGLWGDEQSVLIMPELWPQYHTRLSRKEMSGGRSRIHAPSPYGRGAIAPVILEHHKYLVKSLDQRIAIAERYDRIRPGAGKRCHSTPELVYDSMTVAPLGDGTLRAWRADELRRIVNVRESHA